MRTEWSLPMQRIKKGGEHKVSDIAHTVSHLRLLRRMARYSGHVSSTFAGDEPKEVAREDSSVLPENVCLENLGE